MSHEIAQLLGEMKGKLEMVIANQEKHDSRFDAIDGRLRKVETKSAMMGALSGGLVSVGVALMIEKGKRTLGL
ncbi:MAG: hypothetical protein DYH15_12210 [Nitrosomonas sp. PRO4]|nr:hypothetical protein [Nitrosomonas sp. PRO4]